MRDFLQARLPEPWQVLGVGLRPYSLGHKLLMLRIDNAFESHRVPGLGDLLSGLVICGHSYADGQAMLFTGLKEKVKEIKKSVANANFSWGAKARMFADYLEYHSVIPCYRPVARRGDSAGPTGMPFPLHVLHLLQREYGMREADILDRCWSLCLWDYAGALEYHGHAEIVSDDERDQQKELKIAADKFDADYRAGKVRVEHG